MSRYEIVSFDEADVVDDVDRDAQEAETDEQEPGALPAPDDLGPGDE